MTPFWTRHHERLTQLAQIFATSAERTGKTALADYLGIAQREIRRWLPGPTKAPGTIPALKQQQIDRVVRIEAEPGSRTITLAPDEVAVVMRRREDGRERE